MIHSATRTEAQNTNPPDSTMSPQVVLPVKTGRKPNSPTLETTVTVETRMKRQRLNPGVSLTIQRNLGNTAVCLNVFGTLSATLETDTNTGELSHEQRTDTIVKTGYLISPTLMATIMVPVLVITTTGETPLITKKLHGVLLLTSSNDGTTLPRLNAIERSTPSTELKEREQRYILRDQTERLIVDIGQ